MIWAGEHYVTWGSNKVQGTYTCCAEQHCCQHFRKSLALKVLHMSVSMPAIGEPHTYDLALDGLAHLLEHLFRHGGDGEINWRLVGDWEGCDQNSVLPRVSRCNPAPWLFCGSSTVDVAAIKGTGTPHPRGRRDHQQGARSPQPPSEHCNWAAFALEHDTPRDYHAWEVPSAAPVAQSQSERHKNKLDPDR